MDEPTLEACLAKVDRADALLHELADKWIAFLKSDPYPHWIDTESEPGWHRIYFDFSPPPWPHFSVMAGEIAHDLRSALDHLAWREATEFLGHVPTKSQERSIEFPLRRSRTDFKDAPVLRFVNKDARALMERYQPYKRRDGIGPKSLGLLHWFNRVDKHHAIHIGAAAPPRAIHARLFIDYNPTASLRVVMPCLPPRRLLKGQTEVVRLRFDAGSDPNVRVHRAPSLNISFGNVPRRLRGPDMNETAQYVRRVVMDFGHLLPGH